MPVPKKVSDRIQTGLKRFRPIIESAKARDVNESDTSMIVTDFVADVLGFDKYSEITREFAIRGTYCDLATKVDGKVQTLIEIKAVGVELKDAHVKQAVDYAANAGIEWVTLTNAQYWRVYRVGFSKPITSDLVLEIDVLNAAATTEDSIDLMYLLSREGILRSGLDSHHAQLQAKNRFYLAAVLLSEPVLSTIRRELKRITPDIQISIDEVAASLREEVLKRDVLDGDRASEAARIVSRAARNVLRRRKDEDDPEESSDGSGANNDS